jgi:hypothetical protein
MLIGYVSDERYMALADVLLEFQSGGKTRAIVRSTPRGVVEGSLEPGEYEVTLVKPGYGSKHSRMTVDANHPHHFRLLADGLLGYVWPRAVKSGGRSGGASGHETDKRSRHSPPGTELLAKGTNRDDGGAEIVCYETPKGGAVFSVGSITWVPCLLVDDAVSRITSNVVTRYLARNQSKIS